MKDGGGKEREEDGRKEEGMEEEEIEEQEGRGGWMEK